MSESKNCQWCNEIHDYHDFETCRDNLMKICDQRYDIIDSLEGKLLEKEKENGKLHDKIGRMGDILGENGLEYDSDE
jgi:hypothetical protein